MAIKSVPFLSFKGHHNLKTLAESLLSRLFVFLMWGLQPRENQQGWKLVSAAAGGTGASIISSSSNQTPCGWSPLPIPYHMPDVLGFILCWYQDDTQDNPVPLVRWEIIKMKKALKALYNYRNTYFFEKTLFFIIVIVSLLHHHCFVDCVSFPLHSTDNFLSCHTSFL